MKNLSLFIRIILLFLLTGCTTGTVPVIVNFEGKMSEKKFAVKELNPELPADWSSYGFLTFELKSSTTQRFDLKLYDRAGVRRVTMQPFQGAWIGASIPLRSTRTRSCSGVGTNNKPGRKGCCI